MNIVTQYFTQNPYIKDGKSLTGKSFRGFFLHEIAVAQPSPDVMFRNFDKADHTNAAISGFIGADKVIITAPCLETPGTAKRMPHAGSPANNYYIGFEMCNPGTLKYNANHTAFTVAAADLPAAREFVRKEYNNAVALFARLCAFHGKDPLADGVILSHREGYLRGIATNHGDPEGLWKGLWLDYTMDKFRKDVAAKMEEERDLTKAETEALMKGMLEKALEDIGEKTADQITARVGKLIGDIGDIPSKDVAVELQELLDCGAINGGTPAEVNPNDINMPYEAVRTLVVAKRYIDHKLNQP